MNFNFFLYFVVLLCYGRGIKCENTVEPIQDVNSLPTGPFSTSTDPSKSTTSSAFPEYAGLIRAQDVLEVEDNADEKIEKIVNTIKKISSSCVEYQSIKLDTDGYSFSKNSTGFTINLGEAEKNALFYNFSISYWNNKQEKSFLTASTFLSCNSNTSTVEIGLPNNIKISANLKINNRSGKLITKEGTIAVIFKNAAISHQITLNTSTTSDVDNSNTSKLSYDNSEASVKIDTKFQTLIYKKLDIFINKMESSLKQFFTEQLVTEINKRNISPTDTCSEIMKKDGNLKLVNSTLSSILNDIYVIPKVEQDTWNNVTLSAGPILIFDLFPHDSAEFIVKESSVRDQYAYNANRIVKELISRIKINSFKGNLEWRYNSNLIDGSNPLSIFFTAHNLQIDSTISTSGRYTFVDVNIEKIEIKISELISCENEKRFIDIILSEYLKSVIAKSIANSITQKLGNNPPSYVCVGNEHQYG